MNSSPIKKSKQTVPRHFFLIFHIDKIRPTRSGKSSLFYSGVL